MKKILNFIVCMIALFPFTNVFAAQLQCGKGETLESSVKSFKCVNINGDTLTFTHKKSGNTEDYSKYFKLDEDDKSIVRIVDDSFLKNYDSSSEVIVISISDGSSTAGVAIKNPNYVVPTTTEATTTTTTTNPNAKVYNVILQDEEEKTEKKCEVTDNNDTCSISLPQITKEGFNGWGTADGCKEGSRGTIKVDKDTTYYACYNNKTSSSKEKTQKLYLNSLKLTDKDTKKEIKFGTFSIKKSEYEFKVLNEVENIEVEAEADDGITVEVEGNEGLKEGKNEIVITLKDEEGNEATYTLKVTRLKKGETISSVHYLKSLIIGGVDNFKFDKNTFNYTVTVDNKLTSLEINTETENKEDKVQIIGNSNLEDGSVVKIFVGEDEEKTIYNINVVKEGGINILVIIVGVILVIILILTVLIFLKSNKKNNSNPQKKEKTKKEKKGKKISNKPDVLGSNNTSNDNIEVLKF